MAAGLLERMLRASMARLQSLQSLGSCHCCRGILNVLDRSRMARTRVTRDGPNGNGPDGPNVATQLEGLGESPLGETPWRPGNTWFYAVLVALEAFSLAVQQKWVTLFLLLLALRALQRAAVEPPPLVRNGRNGVGSLLLQGPLWWCSLLVAGEASGLALRELRPEPELTSITSAAVVWLALLMALACSVNWTRCQAGYRRWQRRNSTFVLSIGQTVDRAA